MLAVLKHFVKSFKSNLLSCMSHITDGNAKTLLCVHDTILKQLNKIK